MSIYPARRARQDGEEPHRHVLQSPRSVLAGTHNKELCAIVRRLWKFKDDQPQRAQHLDLFAAEVREMRETLQALK